jgi:hypothetical protein
MTTTRYAVIPAPGYTGNVAKVLSAHATLAAAKRNAGKGYAVISGNNLWKGKPIYMDSLNSVYRVES